MNVLQYQRYLDTIISSQSILWLNRRRMNAQMMQHLSDLHCDRHKVVFPRRQYMYGRDEFVLRELPDVELV